MLRGSFTTAGDGWRSLSWEYHLIHIFNGRRQKQRVTEDFLHPVTCNSLFIISIAYEKYSSSDSNWICLFITWPALSGHVYACIKKLIILDPPNTGFGIMIRFLGICHSYRVIASHKFLRRPVPRVRHIQRKASVQLAKRLSITSYRFCNTVPSVGNTCMLVICPYTSTINNLWVWLEAMDPRYSHLLRKVLILQREDQDFSS